MQDAAPVILCQNSQTRDKEYELTKGNPESKILYFTANPNGEAETVRVVHKPKKRLRNIQFDFDFSTVVVKGRGSMGNILTKNAVFKISLKESGLSTLGGRKIWFDRDVARLNSDQRGDFLGEFSKGSIGSSSFSAIMTSLQLVQYHTGKATP